MRPRRLPIVLSTLAGTLALGGLTLAGSAPAGADPYCGITWGSLPKSVLEYTGAPVTNTRVGRHDCWDRLVVDLAGTPAPGYNVRYVDAFRNEDTGAVVPVSGGAVLVVTARASAGAVPWRFGTHIVTPEQFRAAGFRTFRDLVYGGTYEGSTDFALGVRARLPFRVFSLAGPGSGTRLVVDVAHQW